MSETRLTEEERWDLQRSDESCGCVGVSDRTFAVVESILAARLAKVEALATTGRSDGWVWKRDLRAALSPVSPSAPHDTEEDQ